jgi:hypothetical protein
LFLGFEEKTYLAGVEQQIHLPLAPQSWQRRSCFIFSIAASLCQ